MQRQKHRKKKKKRKLSIAEKKRLENHNQKKSSQAQNDHKKPVIQIQQLRKFTNWELNQLMIPKSYSKKPTKFIIIIF